MGLIDSHAHLTFPELSSQIDAVLNRCAQAGVDRIISVGTDLTDAANAVQLALRFPQQISVAAGFHPHEADKIAAADIEAMAQLWRKPQIVALGEMGLDYHYDFADQERQRQVFGSQLERAVGVDKPVIIHAREALDDTERMLLEAGFSGRKVVFHCFTGSAEDASRIAANGWRVSFTGIVTFKNSTWLQEIARVYPTEQLMVETDAPYLSPMPVRNKRPNEPSFVSHTARFLAELRGVSYEEFVAQSSSATKSFFNL